MPCICLSKPSLTLSYSLSSETCSCFAPSSSPAEALLHHDQGHRWEPGGFRQRRFWHHWSDTWRRDQLPSGAKGWRGESRSNQQKDCQVLPFVTFLGWLSDLSGVKTWLSFWGIKRSRMEEAGGWWFQIFFIVPPIWGNDSQFDEHIFQMGWFNHQLEEITSFFQSWPFDSPNGGHLKTPGKVTNKTLKKATRKNLGCLFS